MNDLTLWLTCLTGPSRMHSLFLRQHLDPNLHVDASLSFSLCFAFENKCAGWHLTDGWVARGHNIGWAVSVALELVIYWLIQRGFHNVDVTVHSNNTGVIAAFSNRKSRNTAQNDCIQCITYDLIPVCLTISPMYILSCENLADPVSHGHTDGYDAHLTCTFPLLIPL